MMDISKFFIFSGVDRINRIQYLAYSFIVSMIGILFFLGTFFLNAHIFPYIFILVNILVFINLIILDIKRLHDINSSGVLAILVFLPIINIILKLVLSIIPGTEGANRFGLQPAKAKKVEYIIAIFGIIFHPVVVLIMCAILV